MSVSRERQSNAKIDASLSDGKPQKVWLRKMLLHVAVLKAHENWTIASKNTTKAMHRHASHTVCNPHDKCIANEIRIFSIWLLQRMGQKSDTKVKFIASRSYTKMKSIHWLAPLITTTRCARLPLFYGCGLYKFSMRALQNFPTIPISIAIPGLLIPTRAWWIRCVAPLPNDPAGGHNRHGAFESFALWQTSTQTDKTLPSLLWHLCGHGDGRENRHMYQHSHGPPPPKMKFRSQTTRPSCKGFCTTLIHALPKSEATSCARALAGSTGARWTCRSVSAMILMCTVMLHANWLTTRLLRLL